MNTLPGESHVHVMESYYNFVKSKVRIGVEGYNMSSLQPLDLVRSLAKLFASCGDVFHVEVPRDLQTNAINGTCTIVVLRGEGAQEKALALNGTDMGGWILSLTVLPPALSKLSSGLSTAELAAQHVSHFQRNRSEGISVTGYDPSLPGDAVKVDLTNRFSSCGKITDVFVLNSRALIYFFGIGAVDNALRLCREPDSVLRAKPLPTPKRKINRDHPSCGPFI
ncbi:unnamed protein product [Eruca vesicaria subsp. sativa]|uniref:RRM domain-containing protein n=1 Tax=Eruca vesicaria subsp. sativa TaxID=29727 RepID=A0ABC8L7P6_ERUVS|nr:unnamed protein product [Eruca vesicaria subsp. sativa]